MRKVSFALAALLFAVSLHAAAPQSVPSPAVNINKATAEQLAYLPGIGSKIAGGIIAARPFATVADLERVKGIGVKKLAALTPYATTSGPTTATAKIRIPKPATPQK
jgi:competence ComEA-like helix-hairpin-helix protein